MGYDHVIRWFVLSEDSISILTHSFIRIIEIRSQMIVYASVFDMEGAISGPLAHSGLGNGVLSGGAPTSSLITIDKKKSSRSIKTGDPKIISFIISI